MSIARRGFTLVELLVVVGVIAVLISILLPALNKARSHARTLQCASNMRQIGQAINLYVNEFKGYLPASICINYGSAGDFRWHVYTGYRYLGSQFVRDENTNPFTWGLQKQNRWNNVYTCPDDIAGIEHGGGSGRIWQGGEGMSYVANGNVLTAWSSGTGSARTAFNRMARVNRSSDVAMLMEKKGSAFMGSTIGGNFVRPPTSGTGTGDRIWRMSDGYEPYTSGENASTQFGRHGSGPRRDTERYSNVLYADFRVELTPYKYCWSTRTADYAVGGKYRAFWGF